MGEYEDNEFSEKLISVDDLESPVILLPWYPNPAAFDTGGDGMKELEPQPVPLQWCLSEIDGGIEVNLEYEMINDFGRKIILLPWYPSQVDCVAKCGTDYYGTEAIIFPGTFNSGLAEASTSAGPPANLVSQFVGMGFPEKIVKRTLEENGEGNTNILLEILLAHKALDNDSSEAEEIPCDLNDLLKSDNSPKDEGEYEDNEFSEKLISVDDLESSVILLPWYPNPAAFDTGGDGMKELEPQPVPLQWCLSEIDGGIEVNLEYEMINDFGRKIILLPWYPSQVDCVAKCSTDYYGTEAIILPGTFNSGLAEASTSACPPANLVSQFVGMGFPEKIVKQTLEENGEGNTNILLEILLAHTALDNDSSEAEKIPCDLNDLLKSDNSPKDEENVPSTHLLEKEINFLHLVDMGFPAEQALSAIDASGPDTSIAELMDFICAFQASRSFDAPLQEPARHILDDDEAPLILTKEWLVPISLTPPLTIQEAFPLTKEWWPSWDNRTKLNSLGTHIASGKIVQELGDILEQWTNTPPIETQKYVLSECRNNNLIWIGKNKLASLEPDEMELILGYPKNHTRGGGISRRDRYKSLGNTFQVDTVAYHLSVLKSIFPDGVNVLSLFSGIGGAEVALHRLGIPLKNVVSVEISEVNRNIVRSWWHQTKQNGKLFELKDVQELSVDKLKHFIESLGGFDLVIGGSPCNNLSGNNRVSRDGLQGEHSVLFYDYFRILKDIKFIMGSCR